MKRTLALILALLMMTGLFAITASASAPSFVWPVPGYYHVSSPFGWRGRRMHQGIDITGVPGVDINGATVVAAAAGTVELIGWHSSFGQQVIIDHGNGFRTRYAHLQSNSTSGITRGQQVRAGQPIGRVGRTGNATGPHLHFEVIVNGVPQNPLNFVSRYTRAQPANDTWWYDLPGWLDFILRFVFFGWLWMN
ncbi:MAG: M23 family metallopeptidase [Oscillospiraceae bacterium]|nr:M23 family metallopeptidase [Oscillospiraceae bacterium]